MMIFKRNLLLLSSLGRLGILPRLHYKIPSPLNHLWNKLSTTGHAQQGARGKMSQQVYFQKYIKNIILTTKIYPNMFQKGTIKYPGFFSDVKKVLAGFTCGSPALAALSALTHITSAFPRRQGQGAAGGSGQMCCNICIFACNSCFSISTGCSKG